MRKSIQAPSPAWTDPTARATIVGMTVAMQNVDRGLVERIDELVRKHLGAYGVSQVQVDPGEDHDGDPVIFVTVGFKPPSRPIESQAIFDLEAQMADMTWRAGEQRFLHTIYKFIDDQKIVRGA